MIDFITVVQNALQERGLTTQDLFDNEIISKNTFYKYKKRNPSLQSLIKVANFLEMSIPYMYEIVDENKFAPYSTNQSGFYYNLMNFIDLSGKSIRQFCKDLHYAKDNVVRYKKGVEPSVRTLFEIANYFQCSVDELLETKN